MELLTQQSSLLREYYFHGPKDFTLVGRTDIGEEWEVESQKKFWRAVGCNQEPKG